jgi:hypothetical protein
MKKIFTLLFAMVFTATAFVNAQKSNVVKTSLTAPLLRMYTLAYERALNPDMTVQLGGGYFSGFKLGDSRLDGFNVIPEFRYYLSESKDAPAGGFVAPFFRYGNYGIEIGEPTDVDYAKATLTGIGGGILVGVQRLFKETISLEAFIGPAYTSSSVDVEAGDEDAYDLKLFDGFGVRAGVTLGVAF